MDPRVLAVLDRIYASDEQQRAAGLPSAQRTRNLTRNSGQFINLLAMSLTARSVLEIGSSNGASTIWLAVSMRVTGGHVTGTELLPDRAAEANANLAEAGLSDYALVLPGDARQTVLTLAGPFDLVLIDAEKDDYIQHFLTAFERVRAGGVILADNVTSHDLSTYQTMLQERGDVDTVTLAFERGIEFTHKRGRNRN